MFIGTWAMFSGACRCRDPWQTKGFSQSALLALSHQRIIFGRRFAGTEQFRRTPLTCVVDAGVGNVSLCWDGEASADTFDSAEVAPVHGDPRDPGLLGCDRKRALRG